MELAHRISKPKNDGPKIIGAKFSSYKLKQLKLNNASSLKGTDYFINEDYSKETVAIRKEK